MDGDRTGLMIMGMDYASISVYQEEGRLYVGEFICKDARGGKEEVLTDSAPLENAEIWLRVSVKKGAVCSFSYSTNGKKYKKMNTDFTAVEGRWIGARVGLFASSTQLTNDKGYADFDWFRIE